MKRLLLIIMLGLQSFISFAMHQQSSPAFTVKMCFKNKTDQAALITQSSLSPYSSSCLPLNFAPNNTRHLFGIQHGDHDNVYCARIIFDAFRPNQATFQIMEGSTVLLSHRINTHSRQKATLTMTHEGNRFHFKQRENR